VYQNDILVMVRFVL